MASVNFFSIHVKMASNSLLPFQKYSKRRTHLEPLASQRHAIITGGTSGIGKSTALELAMKGMSVTIACRDKERGILVADEISQLSRNSSVRPMVCDLSSFASIVNFVKEYKEIGYPLHVLINNAGIMACPQSYTKDGFEMQFGVNHLGHFLLTSLLLDTLKSSAFSGTCSRVVVLASAAEHIGNLDFKDLNFKFSRGYNPWIAYGQSKLANCLFSFELSRRCKVRGLPITSNCMHPGIVATKLIRYVLPQALIEDSIPIMPRMRSILKLIGIRSFTSLHFKHIYRELNGEADRLSRKALGDMNDSLLCEEYRGGVLFKSHEMKIV